MGTAAGARSATAIDGLALHFPAFTLKLPTLQLPSAFRLRTGPHMILDSAKAPYVQQSPMMMSAPVAMQAVPTQRAPQSAPRSPDQPDQKSCYPSQKSCQWDAQLLERERAREQEIAILKQQIASLASSMETMVRLAERAYQTDARQAEPSAQVRYAAPQPLLPSPTVQSREPQRKGQPRAVRPEIASEASSMQRAAWHTPVNARRLPPPPATAIRFLPTVR
jgi:hypothetical protein